MITKEYNNKMSVEEKAELVARECQRVSEIIGRGTIAYILKIDENHRTVLDSGVFTDGGIDISGQYDKENLYTITLDAIQWIYDYDYLEEIKDIVIDKLNKIKAGEITNKGNGNYVESDDKPCDQNCQGDCEKCVEDFIKRNTKRA